MIGFCCYLFKSANHLRTQIEIGSSPEGQPVVDNIGVDFILGKIDSNFNLILTIITVLFGLFALITFFGVKEQFGFQLRAIKKKSRIQERAWAEHNNEIKSLLLKSDVYPKFEKSVVLIKSILSDTANLIYTQEKFDLNNKGYERFLRLKKNIESVCEKGDK